MHRDFLAPPVLFVLGWLLNFAGPFVFVAGGFGDGIGSLPGGASWRNAIAALLISVVYAAAWFLGYHRVTRSYRSPPVARRRRRPVALVTMLGVFALQVAGVWLMYAAHPARDARFRSALTDGTYGQVFFVLLILMIVTTAYVSLRLVSMRRPLPLLLAAIVLLGAMATLVPLGGRGRALLPLVLLGAGYHYRRRRVPAWAGLAMVALLLLSVINVPFLSGRGGELTLAEKAFGFEAYRNFDGLYNLAALDDRLRTDQLDVQLGRNMVCDVWNDLTASGGGCRDSRQILMRDVYRFPSTTVGFPITKPGEFYLAFDWVGVILGGLLVGALMAWVYRRLALGQPRGVLGPMLYLWIAWEVGLADPSRYFAQELVPALVALAVFGVLAVTDGWPRRSPARHA